MTGEFRKGGPDSDNGRFAIWRKLRRPFDNRRRGSSHIPQVLRSQPQEIKFQDTAESTHVRLESMSPMETGPANLKVEKARRMVSTDRRDCNVSPTRRERIARGRKGFPRLPRSTLSLALPGIQRDSEGGAVAARPPQCRRPRHWVLPPPLDKTNVLHGQLAWRVDPDRGWGELLPLLREEGPRVIPSRRTAEKASRKGVPA